MTGESRGITFHGEFVVLPGFDQNIIQSTGVSKEIVNLSDDPDKGVKSLQALLDLQKKEVGLELRAYNRIFMRKEATPENQQVAAFLVGEIQEFDKGVSLGIGGQVQKVCLAR